MIYKIAKHKESNQPWIFETIQGEGFYTGTPAFFVRLQGCKVGCYFCDEKDSWTLNEGSYFEFSSEELIAKLQELNSELKRVVITGGEPTEQDLSDLLESLTKAGFDVHIETAATGEYIEALYKEYAKPIWLTFSPKEIYSKLIENGKADPQIWAKASELKFVVSNEKSADYIKVIFSKLEETNNKCPIYLTPDWFDFDKNKELVLKLLNEPLILETKLTNKVRMGLQTHKYLGVV